MAYTTGDSVKIISHTSSFHGEPAIFKGYANGRYGNDFVHVSLVNQDKSITLARTSVVPCRTVVHNGKVYGFTTEELEAARKII